MKEKYDALKIEVVVFEADTMDMVTASRPADGVLG